mgnify:CR=1 FL=1
MGRDLGKEDGMAGNLQELVRALLDAGVKKGDGTALTVADLGDVRPPPVRGP